MDAIVSERFITQNIIINNWKNFRRKRALHDHFTHDGRTVGLFGLDDARKFYNILNGMITRCRIHTIYGGKKKKKTTRTYIFKRETFRRPTGKLLRMILS